MGKEFRQDLKELLCSKTYVISVALTAVLSYGYLWMHPVVNVDDTSMIRYFSDGLAPQVGRWTLFLLNKVIPIARFGPFITDFLGVALMAAGASVFGVLLKRLTKNRLHAAFYPVFTCLMLSYPMIFEVYTYYLHNGVGLAYLLTMLAVYRITGEKGWKPLLVSSVLLAAAISCYESFAAVYLLGLFLAVMAGLVFTGQKLSLREYAGTVLYGAAALLLGMVMRTVVCRLLLLVLGLDPVMRSVGASIGWIISGEALPRLLAMAKSFARYYVLNAIASPAIGILLAAEVILAGLTVWYAVRTKKKLLLLNGLAVLLTPWLLSFVQGTMVYYRSMQVLPVFTAFALALLVHELLTSGKKWLGRAAVLLAAVVWFWQVSELNHWFYVDHLIYQEDVRRCAAVAVDLERLDSPDKPVVFLGKRKESGTAQEYAYVRKDSAAYRFLSSVDRLFGENEPGEEKRYAIVQNPVWYPMFDWAVDAFGEPGTELIAFFRMHGYPLAAPTQAMKEEALAFGADLPVWPQEGSIVEREDYIIVKLGPV